MLKTRLLVSAVLIPVFIGLCWLDAQAGGTAPVLLVLALLLALQASREVCGLLAAARPAAPVAAAGSLVVLAAVWAWHFMLPLGRDHLAPVGAAGLVFAGVILVLLLRRAVLFREPAGQATAVAAEVFAVGYVGLLLACAAELRWVGGGELGYLALGSLVIGAKVGDSGGYFIGRMFGKRKLSPRLSPGKTWAGAIGAVLTAAVATACWIRLAGPLFGSEVAVRSWPVLLLFGATLGIVGLIGDLCESLLKRDAGLKDASHLMPAFGGLLDLLDSILYTGPVALAFWTFWPPAW